jgi:hypothetical protein
MMMMMKKTSWEFDCSPFGVLVDESRRASLASVALARYIGREIRQTDRLFSNQCC